MEEKARIIRERATRKNKDFSVVNYKRSDRSINNTSSNGIPNSKSTNRLMKKDKIDPEEDRATKEIER